MWHALLNVDSPVKFLVIMISDNLLVIVIYVNVLVIVILTPVTL